MCRLCNGAAKGRGRTACNFIGWCAGTGSAARLVQAVFGVYGQAGAADALPVRAVGTGEFEGLGGCGFIALGVAALGENFQQLGVNRQASRVGAQGFFEDFFGLEVAAVGHVNIGLRNGVHIVGSV